MKQDAGVWYCLTICWTIARILWHPRIGGANGRSDARAWPSLNSRVGAEHAYSRAELGSTKRDHVLADVLRDDLAMLRVGMSQDVLDEVVAILITCNVDQWDARTIKAALTNTIKVAAEKLNTSNLEALLNDLGGELIHAVLRSITDDVVDSSAAIGWSTVLADVLNAPISELAMSNDVNAGKNLLNAGTLMSY